MKKIVVLAVIGIAAAALFGCEAQAQMVSPTVQAEPITSVAATTVVVDSTDLKWQYREIHDDLTDEWTNQVFVVADSVSDPSLFPHGMPSIRLDCGTKYSTNKKQAFTIILNGALPLNYSINHYGPDYGYWVGRFDTESKAHEWVLNTFYDVGHTAMYVNSVGHQGYNKGFYQSLLRSTTLHARLTPLLGNNMVDAFFDVRGLNQMVGKLNKCQLPN
jgi:hypothetical protein